MSTMYFFNVDEQNIVVDSAIAGEFTGTGWIYSGSNKIFPGMYYNAELKKCYTPCQYPSWTLDPETCTWSAPVPKPQDDRNYLWNELEQVWEPMLLVDYKLPYEVTPIVFDIP